MQYFVGIIHHKAITKKKKWRTTHWFVWIVIIITIIISLLKIWICHKRCYCNHCNSKDILINCNIETMKNVQNILLLLETDYEIIMIHSCTVTVDCSPKSTATLPTKCDLFTLLDYYTNAWPSTAKWVIIGANIACFPFHWSLNTKR